LEQLCDFSNVGYLDLEGLRSFLSVLQVPVEIGDILGAMGLEEDSISDKITPQLFEDTFGPLVSQQPAIAHALRQLKATQLDNPPSPAKTPHAPIDDPPSSSSKKLPAPQRALLKDIFARYDTDRSGSLEFEELSIALKRLGIDAKRAELLELFHRIDTSGDGRVDFEEFCNFVATLDTLSEAMSMAEDDTDNMNTTTTTGSMAEDATVASAPIAPLSDETLLQQVFHIIDKDGSGTIERAELVALLLELNYDVTQSELNDIVESFDQDGSGTIDFDEFKNAFQSQYWARDLLQLFHTAFSQHAKFRSLDSQGLDLLEYDAMTLKESGSPAHSQMISTANIHRLHQALRTRYHVIATANPQLQALNELVQEYLGATKELLIDRDSLADRLKEVEARLQSAESDQSLLAGQLREAQAMREEVEQYRLQWEKASKESSGLKERLKAKEKAWRKDQALLQELRQQLEAQIQQQASSTRQLQQHSQLQQEKERLVEEIRQKEKRIGQLEAAAEQHVLAERQWEPLNHQRKFQLQQLADLQRENAAVMEEKCEIEQQLVAAQQEIQRLEVRHHEMQRAQLEHGNNSRRVEDDKTRAKNNDQGKHQHPHRSVSDDNEKNRGEEQGDDNNNNNDNDNGNGNPWMIELSAVMHQLEAKECERQVAEAKSTVAALQHELEVLRGQTSGIDQREKDVSIAQQMKHQLSAMTTNIEAKEATLKEMGKRMHALEKQYAIASQEEVIAQRRAAYFAKVVEKLWMSQSRSICQEEGIVIGNKGKGKHPHLHRKQVSPKWKGKTKPPNAAAAAQNALQSQVTHMLEACRHDLMSRLSGRSAGTLPDGHLAQMLLSGSKLRGKREGDEFLEPVDVVTRRQPYPSTPPDKVPLPRLEAPARILALVHNHNEGSPAAASQLTAFMQSYMNNSEKFALSRFAYIEVFEKHQQRMSQAEEARLESLNIRENISVRQDRGESCSELLDLYSEQLKRYLSLAKDVAELRQTLDVKQADLQNAAEQLQLSRAELANSDEGRQLMLRVEPDGLRIEEDILHNHHRAPADEQPEYEEEYEEEEEEDELNTSQGNQLMHSKLQRAHQQRLKAAQEQGAVNDLQQELATLMSNVPEDGLPSVLADALQEAGAWEEGDALRLATLLGQSTAF
jgi:Ca2+-binding EF-hand superfamily protein